MLLLSEKKNAHFTKYTLAIITYATPRTPTSMYKLLLQHSLRITQTHIDPSLPRKNSLLLCRWCHVWSVWKISNEDKNICPTFVLFFQWASTFLAIPLFIYSCVHVCNVCIMQRHSKSRLSCQGVDKEEELQERSGREAGGQFNRWLFHHNTGASKPLRGLIDAECQEHRTMQSVRVWFEQRLMTIWNKLYRFRSVYTNENRILNILLYFVQ